MIDYISRKLEKCLKIKHLGISHCFWDKDLYSECAS